MPRSRRIFLAWENLIHDPRRLALALVGIGFAVLLMCMQVGFRNALFDSTVALIDDLNADIIVTSTARYTLAVSEQFSRRRLYQALSCPHVAAAYPFYIENRAAILKNPETGLGHPIRVLAFDPQDPVFLSAQVQQEQEKLKIADTILMDAKSKSDYGPVVPGVVTELSGTSVRVVGLFQFGTDFANDGNLMTSAGTLCGIFRAPAAGSDPLGQVDVGLIRVEKGANVRRVRAALVELLPDDVDILTKNQFRARELEFWRRSTPIGFVFGLGTAMGFLVGVIICYQILYTDIADHMAEFATLKAVGYANRFFVGVVLQEALLLSILGFIPGVAISALLYEWLGVATGLRLDLTWGRGAMILAMTVAMCIASAALAVRKVLSADPAELF